MNNKDKINLIEKNELFWNVDEEILKTRINDENVFEQSFKSGELLFKENFIGIVVSGKCEFKQSSGSTSIISFRRGEAFADNYLFSSQDLSNGKFFSKGQTKILYVSKDVVSFLIATSPAFCVSFIKSISKKIDFLSKKIEGMTGKSTESKVAGFLLEKFEDYKVYRLEESATELASILNIGRASLYRAFSTFEKCNAIEKSGKSIRLLSREELIKFI